MNSQGGHGRQRYGTARHSQLVAICCQPVQATSGNRLLADVSGGKPRVTVLAVMRIASARHVEAKENKMDLRRMRPALALAGVATLTAALAACGGGGGNGGGRRGGGETPGQPVCA